MTPRKPKGRPGPPKGEGGRPKADAAKVREGVRLVVALGVLILLPSMVQALWFGRGLRGSPPALVLEQDRVYSWGPASIPADHLTALDAWGDMIRSGRVYALKETALHGQFAAKIIEGVLGYHGPAGGADYTVATEQAILRGSVDLALGR